MTAITSIPKAPPNEHFAYIDLLRGIAIFGVLSAHAGLGMAAAGLTQLPFRIDWLFGAGKHGVSLFFVVSAYTLIRSMNSRYRSDEPMIASYIVRRFFRIAPAYYLVLLLIFFLHGKGFGGYTPPGATALAWVDLAAHLFFVNGLSPYFINSFIGVEWSIATEFMFYALLPCIFLWLRKSSSHTVLAIKASILYLAGLVLLWFMYFKGGHMQKIIGRYPIEIFGPWIYFFILSHIHEFAAGIAAWVTLKILSERNSPRPGPAATKLALGGLVVFGMILAYAEALRGDSVYMIVGSQVLWGLLGAGLIYVLSVLRPGRISGLTFLGRISFSLYLVHMPVFYGLSKLSVIWSITDFAIVNFGIYLLLAWCLALTAAVLLFYFVEKPGIRTGQALLDRFSKPLFAI